MRARFLLLFVWVSWQLQAQQAYITVEQDSASLGTPIIVKLYIEGFAQKDILEVDWSHFDALKCPVNDSIDVSVDLEMVNDGQFLGKDKVWNQDELKWTRDNSGTVQALVNPFTIIAWEHFTCPLPGPIIRLTDSLEIQTNNLPILQLKSAHGDAFENLVLGAQITAIKDTTVLVPFPLTDIIRSELGLLDYLVMYWWILAILMVIIIVWILIARKPVQKIESEPTVIIPPKIPPHITALEALKNLKNSREWDKGEDKLFVSKLTDIIRSYISDRFDVKAKEMTSSEVIHEVNNLLDQAQISKLNNTLNVADLIKFAKATADQDTYEQFVDEAIDLVQSTKKNAQDDGN